MKPNYKKLEIEIKELVTQGRSVLYDIATRCVMLLNDCDNYAVSLNQKSEEVIERLQGYLADFNLTLDEAVLILKIFPDKPDWLKFKSVRELYDAAVAKVNADKKHEQSEANSVPQRRSIKVAEFEAVVKERNEAAYEAKQQRDQVARLMAENDQLRARVATLEGQVQELRRMADAVKVG